MRRSILILIGFILLLPRLAAAQWGTVSGTITAASDGSPVAGAKVVAFIANGLQATDPGGFALVGTTGSSGVYSFPVYSAGPFYLRIAAVGYVTQLYNGIACDPAFDCGIPLGRPGTPVTVAQGATVTINVALDRGATISGTVTRASNGTTISGVSVRFFRTSGQLTATAQTANDGTYSITGLPFGTYYARTVALGLGTHDYVDEVYGGLVCSVLDCPVFSGTPIVVSPGSSTATADFSLDSSGSISGTVTDTHTGAGAPFIGILVLPGQYRITTDSTGRYTVTGLLPGSYTVRTVSTGSAPDMFVHKWYRDTCVLCPGAIPTPVAVTSGATTSGIDISVDETAGSISGTLTLTGYSSAGNVELPAIQIYNAGGTFVSTAIPSRPASGDTLQWTATNLPPGTYYVETASTSGVVSDFNGLATSGLWVDKLFNNTICLETCDPTRGTPVTVGPNAVTSGVNFTLDLGAQITGMAPRFGDVASQIQVFDSRGARLMQRGGLNTLSTPSGPQASYTVFGLPPGTYYLQAGPFVLPPATSGTPQVLYKGVPCGGCAVTTGTPVTLAAGEVKTGIDFTALAGQAISGTVRSDGSSNPPNQPIALVNIQAYTVSGTLAATATTSLDGTYRLPNLAAGTYTVRTSNARGFIDPLIGTAVTITQGSDTTGIDFGLSQGQLVTGRVTPNDATFLNGASVVFYTATPDSPAARATVDPSGAFTTTLPPASYYAQTDPVAGYVQQIYNGIACPQGVCPTGSATPVVVTSAPLSAIDFSLAVCTAPVVGPAGLAQAAVGIAYRQTIVTNAPSGGIRFVVTSGALPPGLSLDPTTGVLSGTPTTSGQFTFTVAAVDSIGCAGTRIYTLDVPPCAFTVSPTSVTVPAGGGSWAVGFGNACGSLAVASNMSWITVSSPVSSMVGGVVAPNTGGPRQGTVSIGPRVITIFQSGVASSPPFGFVDTPADGVVASGSLAISGWALDDVGVNRVLVYRDPVAGEPAQLIFVGLATFLTGARPDVAVAYPTLPANNRAGWGYLLLTNMLPNQGNGTFRLSVFAEDTDLNRTLLGTKLINAANASATAPFGAIDTPDQGGTVSGTALVNFGWALTPQPKMIPFDGSTIHVLIDGVDVGPVTAYNFFRSDVSGLFPGLKNSGGPIGYRMIDTTALSEGLHTIAWLATDDGGKTTGIGSRYFTVNNSAWQPSLRANFAAMPPAVTASELAQASAVNQGVRPEGSTAVPPRVDGVDLGRKAASLASLPLGEERADEGKPEALRAQRQLRDETNAVRIVQMSNLQVLELSLASTAQAVAPANACGPTYAGYLVANGELHPLPIGSSLDPAGTFYWHPGPGFFGTYHLLFVRTSCDGTRQRIPVTIVVR